ncbi:MAG TPA: response regulator, partial [Spirochaetales bacterium]|nr:response regulator [Spirochaetales bacterium]
MAKPEKHSILYVDDDKQNLFLFQSLFGHLYQVFTATSGKEALSILAEHSFQVLFADQRMAEMNGIQLLERIAGQYPDIIRILVTGYSDTDVAIDAINRGSVYRY